MNPERPKCRACKKPLRRYRYRQGGPNSVSWAHAGQQWGDYGDNLFCGLTCGYRFAVRMERLERRKP